MKNNSFFNSLNTKFNSQSSFLINLILFLTVVLIIISITSIYVSNEHTIYWWDFVGYQNAANNLTNLFRASTQRAIDDILGSLSQQKNYLITLPLIPFLYIFGNHRIVYILSLNLVYLLPFSLLIGAIATKLIPIYPRWVFWSTVAIALLIPMSWSPSLRGYPDIGATLPILLGILFYLKNIRLTAWWQIPIIGICLGISIVLRRHFAYSAIAFLAAISCQVILDSLTNFKFAIPTVNPPKSPLERGTFNSSKSPLERGTLLESGIKISLISLTSFLTISIFAWGFIQSSLTENYRTLYAAWSLSIPDIFWRYACFYGLITLLLVAIGFSVGILRKFLIPSTTIFLLLFGIFSLAEWLILLRYGNIHYSLHLTPIIVLGITSFIWITIYTFRGKTKLIILSITGIYLIINLIFGLTPIGKFNNPIRPIFASNFSSLIRSDYDEVLSLTKYLSNLAPNRELVYVAASSNQFNANIIRNSNRIINPENWSNLRAISKPHIDTRDTYPLPELLAAQYVVIATPFQKVLLTDEQVLKPGQQDLVKFVYDAFSQNLPIAQDFRKLPEEFVLDGGVTVSFYQRIRPTSIATAVQTLSAMQKEVPQRPGRQLDWMSLSQSPYITYNYSAVIQVSDDGYNLMTDPADVTKETSKYFLYLGDLSSSVKITGKLDFLHQECNGLSVRFSLLDEQGNLLDTTAKNYFPGVTSDLIFSLAGKSSVYLLLEILSIDSNKLTDKCGWIINDLVVNK
ncbi:MAG: hypothetical protein F6K40_11230 [Okeania sp. SIO3I5]|uniref:hypothetical protein n=1 Tax=Okeania sp. SIO3I5 TaxID=2607805 RepID=UPI0013BE369D|nr:hypothetical protein [Okeania sp. SIO3I5]NEQ36817.1 hypothetical protein [Okeania sp. SIO3I5]